jgi:D-alanyl-D-alanine carboxypeptidase
MSKKKKYKLKTWPKIVFIILIIGVFGSIYGYKKYQEYKYTQTYEYKLLQKYNEEETKILLDNLSNEELDDILSRDYNEFITHFVKCKYFMYKNLDVYLTKVISQSQDFFKYHGTDGYDYDNIIAIVNTHNNEEYYSGDYHTDYSKGTGIIANKYYELGMDFVPEDLVDVPITHRYSDRVQLTREAYDAYMEMWNAAKEEQDIYLILASGYRSAKEQKEVYDEYDQSYGREFADNVAARPGYSEHQTGLAIDVYSKECSSAKTFKDSKTYAWLIDNSYKYGFILRYPENKKSLTGYNYESWHYRYLGKDLAKKVHDSGLTYDEYYAYYLDK